MSRLLTLAVLLVGCDPSPSQPANSAPQGVRPTAPAVPLESADAMPLSIGDRTDLPAPLVSGPDAEALREVGPIVGPAPDDSLLNPAQLRELRTQLKSELRRRAGTSLRLGRIPDDEAAKWYLAAAQYKEVGKDRRKIAALAAWHLGVAERLFESDSQPIRTSALAVVREVVNGVSLRLKDHQLAAVVCDAWLLPNLSEAHPTSYNANSRQNTVETAVGVYFRAKSAERLHHAAQLWLHSAADRNEADAARFRIAQSLEMMERFDEAADWLEKISEDTGMRGVRSRIPTLRAKAANGGSM